MIDLGVGRIQDAQGAESVPPISAASRIKSDTSKQPKAEQDLDSFELSEDARAAEAEAEPRPPPSGREELEANVEELNRLLGSQRELQFRVSEESANIRIEIVDTESGEVIRSIPPTDLDAVSDRLRSGNLFVDDNI